MSDNEICEMSDNEICDMIYSSVEILHNDYDVLNAQVFILVEKDGTHSVYTDVKYWKNNDVYQKIFKNKLEKSVDDDNR